MSNAANCTTCSDSQQVRITVEDSQGRMQSHWSRCPDCA